MERWTVNDLLAESRRVLDRLEPAEALAEQSRGALIVDTRCESTIRRTGTIPGAAHVPLSVLYWRLDPASGYEDPRLADPERRVILVCDHGYSSSIAAATLRDLGFARATDVVGGFEAWQAAGLPVEPGGPEAPVTG